MKWLRLAAIIASVNGVNCFAQTSTIVTFPKIGVETTVPAGSELFSFARVYTVPGAKLEASARGGAVLMEENFPAGTILLPDQTKYAFKACVPLEGTLRPGSPCFIDETGDGTFDRQNGAIFDGDRKLKASVPYSKVDVSAVGPSDSLKKVFLFQGADSGSLRFSYREFINDMARPAFTEDLTIPREQLPSMIMLKGLQIEVRGVTGMGLTYVIMKAN